MQNAPSLRLSKIIHAQLILIMLNSYLHSSRNDISIKYTIERIMNIAIERCRYILVIFSPTYNKGIELLMHGVLMKLLKTKPGIITKIKKLTTNFREVMVQQLVEFLISSLSSKIHVPVYKIQRRLMMLLFLFFCMSVLRSISCCYLSCSNLRSCKYSGSSKSLSRGFSIFNRNS